MEERKDIQMELAKLVAGMTTNNIYSQLTYFLIRVACQKENPITESSEICEILGLIADSYFGRVAMGAINQIKEKE